MKFTEAKLEQVFIELLSAGEMDTEAVLAEPNGSCTNRDKK